MASHLRAWLRHKLRSAGKTLPRETTSRDPNPQKAPSKREDAPPPPYDALGLAHDSTAQPPMNTDETDTIQDLRSRNPATAPSSKTSCIFKPPPHKTTPIEATTAAASSAITGVCRALDETDPRMVAARTAQAIAVAVSTSRSYAAFIAAVTAAESTAYLLLEADRDQISSARRMVRARHAVRAAADTALAADAGITATGSWPFNINDSHAGESSSVPAHHWPRALARRP